MTTFGSRLRELRLKTYLCQKRLEVSSGVHHTYLSKSESEKLDFALFTSEQLVKKPAAALEADETDLLAQKVPPLIHDCVLQRPADSCKLAALDDQARDEVIRQVDNRKRSRR